MAGQHGNNLAGRNSDPGRRPEKEWQKIGIVTAYVGRQYIKFDFRELFLAALFLK